MFFAMSLTYSKAHFILTYLHHVVLYRKCNLNKSIMETQKPPVHVIPRDETLKTKKECKEFWIKLFNHNLNALGLYLHCVTFKLKVYKQPNWWQQILGIRPIEEKQFTTTKRIHPWVDNENKAWLFEISLNSEDDRILQEMNPYPLHKWNSYRMMGSLSGSFVKIIELDLRYIISAEFGPPFYSQH